MLVTIPTDDNSNFNSTVSSDLREFSFLTMVETVTGQLFSIENRGRYTKESPSPGYIFDKLPVNVLLCSSLEPREVQYFQNRGVEVFTGVTGTVREAMSNYRQGVLSKLPHPDLAVVGCA